MRTCILVCTLLFAGIAKAGVFDTLKTIPAARRPQVAQDIYNKIKYLDSVSSTSSVNELVSVSRQLNDGALECFSTSLLADIYARIRGFNSHSTALHQKAIAMAREKDLPLMAGICTFRTGRYFYNFRQYPPAFEYLLRADNYFKTMGYDKVPDMPEILHFMAGIYYESGNIVMAEKYLQEIQQLPNAGPYIRKQSLNTLALINRQRNDDDKALHYFERTLGAALAEPDSVWIGISYANIGSIHYAKKKYAEAYSLFQKSYRLSHTYKEWPHAYSSLLYLARIEILRGQLALAEKNISAAIALHAVYNTLSGQKLLYETQVMYYEATGQVATALKMQNQLLAVKDSIAAGKDQNAYREIQLRIEMEKHLNEIGKLEAEKKAEAFKRNGIIAILALSLVVLLLWYRNYRVKVRSNAAILQADKLRAEEKLKYARQLLQNFTENSRQKNDLIVQFAAELDKLKSSLAGQFITDEKLQDAERLMQSNILSPEEWNSFRDLFEKVHKGFFARLDEKYPGLSEEQTRLVTLTRLGISDREIANMMGIDAAQLHEARRLLQQKLGGDENQTLEDKVRSV